eukprot:scaffold312535_cov34-Prasinocladus_malaysianus.AAC.2
MLQGILGEGSPGREVLATDLPPPVGMSLNAAPGTPSASRVGKSHRLLRQRLKKSQSNNALYEEDEAEAVREQAAVSQKARRMPNPSEASDQRLILIANRLPVTADQRPDGSWKLQ